MEIKKQDVFNQILETIEKNKLSNRDAKSVLIGVLRQLEITELVFSE